MEAEAPPPSPFPPRRPPFARGSPSPKLTMGATRGRTRAAADEMARPDARPVA